MIALQQRTSLLTMIREACAAGARLANACLQIGLSGPTVQRWLHPQSQDVDRRKAEKRAYSCPPNKLSVEGRRAALEMLNSDEFKDLPRSQIVPVWLIRGVAWPRSQRCTVCCAMRGR